MTTSDRAVRKASRERLLRDFARAAQSVNDSMLYWPETGRASEETLWLASVETSRTRYACLMTAFGQ